jgi:hypothetical protein
MLEQSRLVSGEQLFLIASGGVVAHTVRPSIDHPVCASKERGHFIYGAATPPVSGRAF